MSNMSSGSPELLPTVRPIDSSIAAQVQALDLLQARILNLAQEDQWPARIPVNSKASFAGRIVNTKTFKVDVGQGQMVEMTVQEASSYISKRKHGKFRKG